MGKVEDLRAIKEARFAAAQRGAGQAAQPATARSRPVSTKAPAPALGLEFGPAYTPAETTEAACGHRAISGKTCERPRGHTEKNHRYAKA